MTLQNLPGGFFHKSFGKIDPMTPMRIPKLTHDIDQLRRRSIINV
jgi:hypothetical protein